AVVSRPVPGAACGRAGNDQLVVREVELPATGDAQGAELAGSGGSGDVRICGGGDLDRAAGDAQPADAHMVHREHAGVVLGQVSGAGDVAEGRVVSVGIKVAVGGVDEDVACGAVN